MRGIAALSSLLLLSMFVVGGQCPGASSTDGNCSYAETTGALVITSITPTEDGAMICGSPTLTVMGNFVPEDEEDADKGETGLQLSTQTGVLPTQAWLDAQNLGVGSEILAVRGDILTGSCSPIIYYVATESAAEDVLTCDE